MIKYKRIDAANGRIMYYKNGKMVSSAEIEENILKRLESGVELQVNSSEPTAPEQTVDENDQDTAQSDLGKSCIFCGETATRSKFINLQTVPLCDADYDSHTTGEIAAQMREVLQEAK